MSESVSASEEPTCGLRPSLRIECWRDASIDLDRLDAAMTEDKKVLREFGRVAARELFEDEG